MAVTCRDCAIEYEAWPEGGCPNCGSAEPAAPVVPEPAPAAPSKARAARSPAKAKAGGDG